MLNHSMAHWKSSIRFSRSINVEALQHQELCLVFLRYLMINTSRFARNPTLVSLQG